MSLTIAVQAQTTSKNSKPADASPQNPDPIAKRVELYLRNTYAWGPEYAIKIGAITPSPIPDLLAVSFTVSLAEQSQTATLYIDKSGRYLIRGELSDMTIDPLADTRSKLHIGESPSLGPENAPVTIIEFADYECPSCRQLDLIFRDLLPVHPEIRLVFKDFPLTGIHPWAMTAAIAAQCTYKQAPAKFWKMHDAIFDAQDSITVSNAKEKLLELATQLELNIGSYKTCMDDPATEHTVDKTIEEGHQLEVTGTPTTFINARRVIGPDESQIKHFIGFR